jgi:hypothetical protein
VQEGGFGGGLEPAERAEVANARGLEGENDLGQVEALDLRQLAGRALAVFLGRPETEAGAAGGAAGAAGALVGGGLADALDQQGVEPARGVVAGDTGQATIDDQPDAVDGEGCFGDVGGDNDLRAVVTGDGGVLIVRREFAVQREEQVVTGFRELTEGGEGLVDLVASRHEDKDIPARPGTAMAGEGLRGQVPDRGCGGARTARKVADVDIEHAAGRSQDCARVEIGFEHAGVERGGHDEEDEVGPHGLLEFEGAGEGDVAVKMSLVELVEDESPDTGQCGLLDHLTQQNAFRDEPDPGLRARDVFEADLVSDAGAKAGAPFLGHPAGEQAGGQTPGLKDDDLAGRLGGCVGKDLGDLCRLPGAGGGLHHQPAVLAELGPERRADLVDGQGVVHRRVVAQAAAKRNGNPCIPKLSVGSENPPRVGTRPRTGTAHRWRPGAPTGRYRHQPLGDAPGGCRGCKTGFRAMSKTHGIRAWNA